MLVMPDRLEFSREKRVQAYSGIEAFSLLTNVQSFPYIGALATKQQCP